MQLDPYVATMRDGVTQAATLADEPTRDVAQRLAGAIDSAARLALIRALSDATHTINADLAPASVELTMNGTDPEFVVRWPPAGPEPTLLLPEPPTALPAAPVDETLEPEDEGTARISLRLPASVKARVDEMADRDGISTNAWLQRAIMDALGGTRERGERAPASDSLRGLIGAIGPFGPDGPFGPHGVFGPHGPFGTNDRHDRSTGGQHRGRSVQGWVR